MLEVFSKFICSVIMCVSAFYVIKKMTNSKESLFNIKNIILLLLLNVAQLIVHSSVYSITSILITFLLNIIFYKLIFKLTKEEIIICFGIYTIILFFSDMIYVLFAGQFYTTQEIRTVPLLAIFSNLTISILAILISDIKVVKEKCKGFLKLNQTKSRIINRIFFLLVILCAIFMGYNITMRKLTPTQYVVDIGIILLLGVISYMFIVGKINYNQLVEEYNTLFNYVQNFEDWIEKEQLNHHEYKNQLAILRSLAISEEVIKRINEILDDNVKIRDDVVYKLKELPKGGLKGLMYYKVALAQKQNINIEVDVSIKKKSVFNKLNEAQIKVLCNLIGIYFDNAIEAAIETEKKVLELEIYEIKGGIKIVISNSFKKQKNFDKRNEKGVTTKGKGHGNGLYYANNLVLKNRWLETTQEIIDNYYIQNISIKKPD